jgi:hypothetical protein
MQEKDRSWDAKIWRDSTKWAKTTLFQFIARFKAATDL